MNYLILSFQQLTILIFSLRLSAPASFKVIFFFVALISIFHITCWGDLQLSIYISVSEGLSLEQVLLQRGLHQSPMDVWEEEIKGRGASRRVCLLLSPLPSAVLHPLAQSYSYLNLPRKSTSHLQFGFEEKLLRCSGW